MTARLQAIDLAIPGRLDRTSLQVEGGELLCLIGPNGSGKTSLLHALAGIGDASGSVLIDGERLNGMPPDRRKRTLAFLPASRDIAWPLVGKDLIALGAPSGVTEDRTAALLESLDLAALADRRVDRMSTGERSRVLIARALVAEPKVLLLDEPASNLDPLWQIRVMELLAELAREKEQALLVAMHDLELARAYASRLLIMQDGRVAADGNPDTLLSGPYMPQVFGVEWIGGRWRPAVRPPADPRSSP